MMTTSLKTQPKPQKIKAKKRPNLDLIIIGGGPAGLAAALYAIRARLNVLLVEKMILGGLASTTFSIENYPGFPEGVSGMELANRMQEQVKRLGLDIVWGNTTSIQKKKDNFEVMVDNKTLHSKAIIIA
ncbi:MAG: FAD-dependent oxidoreductase, partial [bacterium]